jgi:hypothetical protein
VKDENCDCPADSHNILNRWKNYFSQLLNVHRVSDVRQIEIQTAEPSLPDPRPLDVKTAVAKFKSINHQVVIHTAEIIQAGDEFHSKNHKLIKFIWNKEKLLVQWKEPILYQFTRWVINLTVVIFVGEHSYLLHTKLYPIFFSQG